MLEGFYMGSLAVTYFRTRKCTIIGATLFHGPVRDGKGWVQSAMAAKRNLSVQWNALNTKWEEGVVIAARVMFITELLHLLKVIGSSRTGN